MSLEDLHRLPAPERDFASDNSAPALDEVVAAVVEANQGHALAYGADPWSNQAKSALRDRFGCNGEVLFCFGGTGANVLGVGALLEGRTKVLCSSLAHLALDEAGAPERSLGVQLQLIQATDGKISPKNLELVLDGIGDRRHAAQPGVLSLANATELETAYQRSELETLCAMAHAQGLQVHLDGARLANALVATGMDPSEVFACGVDSLSLGGTKNGLLGAEVVLLADTNDQAAGLHKSVCQLPSKQRYIAAQFLAWLEGDLWLATAQRANDAAQRLTRALESLPEVALEGPVETNGVFCRLSLHVVDSLQEWTPFHTWDSNGLVRFMTSFDTSETDIKRLVAGVRAAHAK